MGSVLVTDGHERAALAVVRSLGRAGYRPFVCSPRARALAGASRYCARQTAVPDALEQPALFAVAVDRLVRQWHIDVLLPITEASLLALLPERQRFEGVRIPFPPDAQFRRICDKAAVLDAAGALGIAVPQYHTLPSPDHRRTLVPAELSYPLVVKPARSVSEANGHRIKSGVAHVRDWDALQRALDQAAAGAYPLLLQRRIVGPGIGIFLLLWEGQVLATFGHRRIREKPPSGGVSVYCESIAAQPDLVAGSRALLERFGWEGVGMVEFKLDVASGIPYLMEVNGRFWGSLQLAIDAGVDFPALLLAAALGGGVGPVRSYRVGVKSRWWWGDVDNLLARLRRSKEDLGLSGDTPGRWRAVAEFLKAAWPGTRGEVLRLRDPMPFVQETLDWLRRR